MRAFLIISLFVAFAASGCSGKRSSAVPVQEGIPEIAFREYEHHFGKVKEGEKISYQFTFDNKGPGDLVLTSVSTTCGCTVPKYDVKPISQGESGRIEVVFDTSGRDGMQTKTITVKSNASKPIVLLKITADVESN